MQYSFELFKKQKLQPFILHSKHELFPLLKIVLSIQFKQVILLFLSEIHDKQLSMKLEQSTHFSLESSMNPSTQLSQTGSEKLLNLQILQLSSHGSQATSFVSLNFKKKPFSQFRHFSKESHIVQFEEQGENS